MSEWIASANPAALTITWYRLGGSDEMTEYPWTFAVTVRDTLVDSSTAVASAEEMIAPEGSVTVPTIVPEFWAIAEVDHMAITNSPISNIRRSTTSWTTWEILDRRECTLMEVLSRLTLVSTLRCLRQTILTRGGRI